MESLPSLIGKVVEAEQLVTEELSAAHIGSGSLKVYATPAMVAFVEKTSRDLCETVLPEGFTSVGVALQVNHLAPTPLGNRVHLTLSVSEVQDNRIQFQARLRDEKEPIGEVEHERVIVDVQRFLKRVDSKA